ncbi:MAG: hypothetical protein AB8B57_03040 [Congregibacter sp.]
MGAGSRLRIVTEVAGALSIVLSLVFVGLELRHANNVAEADSVQQINAMYFEMALAGAHDSELIQLVAERSEIDEAAVRIGFRNASTLNIVEAAWKSFDRGILDEEHYISYMTDGCVVIFPDGFSESILLPDGLMAWNDYKLRLSRRFTEAFENFCGEI